MSAKYNSNILGIPTRIRCSDRLVSVTRWNIGKYKKPDARAKENETANAVRFVSMQASTCANTTGKISLVSQEILTFVSK